MIIEYGRAISYILPSPYMVVLPVPLVPSPFMDPLGPKSHQLLQSIYGRAKQGPLDTKQISRLFYIKEPVKVNAKNLEAWLSTFEYEVEMSGAKKILVTDPKVMRILTPDFVSLTEDHGTLFPWRGRILVPTYRLSLSSQDPSFHKIILRDIERFFFLDSKIPDQTITVVEHIEDIPGGFFTGDIVIDIETTGLEQDSLITMIGLYRPDEKLVYIIHVPPDLQSQADYSYKLAKRAQRCHWVGHNLKFDLGRLAHFHPIWTQFIDVSDTMLLAHNAGESTKSLKHLMTLYTDLPGSRSGGGITDVAYLTQDLLGTAGIRQHFIAQEKTASGVLMSQMSAIFGFLKNRGVYIDRSFLETTRVHYQALEDEESQKLKELAGDINWNSSRQVVQAFSDLGVKLTKRTDAGEYSVAEGVLLEIAQGQDVPVIKALLKYREYKKLISGFLSPFLARETSYIHPSILLHGTETGRLSMAGPNLQQIPRVGPLKLAFKPRWMGGHYGLIDLSQAELRGAALLSGDEVFAQALESEDAHRAIAARIYHLAPEDVTAAQRKKSKGVTFSTLYGSSAKGIATKMGIPVWEAKEIQDGLFNRFKKLQVWADGIREMTQWAKIPFIISTPFGRTRDLSTVLHHEGSGGAYRKAINTGPQSLASDTMLWIARSIYLQLIEGGCQSRPLFTVHDSTLIEIAPGEDEAVQEITMKAFQSLNESPLRNYGLFSVLPFRGELVIGESWAHCESTNENYAPLSSFPVASTR